MISIQLDKKYPERRLVMHSTSHRLLLAFSDLPVMVTIKEHHLRPFLSLLEKKIFGGLFIWRDNKTMVPMLVLDVDEWTWI